MGAIARLLGAERRSSLENPAVPLSAAFGDPTPPAAGVKVTERTALNYSAVWAAVGVISGDLSSVPLPLYRRRKDGGREKESAHPVSRILRRPNDEMTGMMFRNAIQAHVLTWGNGYAEIERTKGGVPVALHLLTPDRVNPDRSRSTGRLVYRVKRESGAEDTLTPDRVFHIAGLAFDGLVGYSPVRMMREAISLGLATEKFGASFFGNGAWAGVVAEHPETLTPDQHSRLSGSWNEIHRGSGNAHRLVILEKGMKISKPLTIPPDDAQFLQTRAFQVVEVARAFNIAVWKLRDMENQHYNNIEHEKISHVTDTLRPWAVRWEAEIDRKLLTEAEQEEFYAEHQFDALLRGDLASRYAAHAVGRQWGWRSVNEVKRLENEDPIGPEGDVYLVPTNMMAADKINDVPAPGTQPPPAPAAKEPEPEPAEKAEPEPKRAKLVAATRAIFVESMGRMVRKEAAAARRMSGRGADACRIWVEEFYQKHQDQMIESLLPAMRAHLVICGDGTGAQEKAEAVACEHVGRSRQELLELLDTKPKVSELEGSVDRLVSRWEIARPGEMADLVFAEENAA